MDIPASSGAQQELCWVGLQTQQAVSPCRHIEQTCTPASSAHDPHHSLSHTYTCAMMGVATGAAQQTARVKKKTNKLRTKQDRGLLLPLLHCHSGSANTACKAARTDKLQGQPRKPPQLQGSSRYVAKRACYRVLPAARVPLVSISMVDKSSTTPCDCRYSIASCCWSVSKPSCCAAHDSGTRQGWYAVNMADTPAATATAGGARQS